MTSERAVAQQTQEKFHFYFLALTFTLLAATIQTSKFGRSTVEDLLELAGWLGLLASGLFGLWKMEWDSVIRVQLTNRDECSTAVSNLKQQKGQGVQQVLVLETGEMQDVDDRITNYEKAVSTLDIQIARLEAKDESKYKVAKYTFVVGLMFVMASRSAAAVLGIFGYIFL